MSDKPKQIFQCKALHYDGDKPHYWYVDNDGRERNYFPYQENLGYRTVRTCNEHRPPITVTAEMLKEQINLPGFTNEVTEDRWSNGRGHVDIWPVFKTTGNGVTITIDFHKHNDKLNCHSTQGTGHTSFGTSQGERTFDRTGVEDSFYVSVHDGVPEVQATLEAQLKRVEESRGRIKNMVPIPGLGFLVTEAGKAEVTALLNAGKSKAFTPSGFGTGYRLSKRQHSKWDHRAKPETEAFFGVSPIYLEEMDCD